MRGTALQPQPRTRRVRECQPDEHRADGHMDTWDTRSSSVARWVIGRRIHARRAQGEGLVSSLACLRETRKEGSHRHGVNQPDVAQNAPQSERESRNESTDRRRTKDACTEGIGPQTKITNTGRTGFEPRGHPSTTGVGGFHYVPWVCFGTKKTKKEPSRKNGADKLERFTSCVIPGTGS